MFFSHESVCAPPCLLRMRRQAGMLLKRQPDHWAGSSPRRSEGGRKALSELRRTSPRNADKGTGEAQAKGRAHQVDRCGIHYSGKAGEFIGLHCDYRIHQYFRTRWGNCFLVAGLPHRARRRRTPTWTDTPCFWRCWRPQRHMSLMTGGICIPVPLGGAAGRGG